MFPHLSALCKKSPPSVPPGGRVQVCSACSSGGPGGARGAAPQGPCSRLAPGERGAAPAEARRAQTWSALGGSAGRGRCGLGGLHHPSACFVSGNTDVIMSARFLTYKTFVKWNLVKIVFIGPSTRPWGPLFGTRGAVRACLGAARTPVEKQAA